MTAKLVDRGLAPAARERRGTGVPRDLLPGPPRDGGFGVLPIMEHINGRWAWWAARLAVSGGDDAGGDEPMWLALARVLLRRVHPDFRPLALLSAPRNTSDAGDMGGFGTLPGGRRSVLRLLAEGLACLPRVEDVVETPLEPGDWCWAAPLWGNPLLPSGPDVRDGGLEHEFWLLCTSRLLSTIGDLVRVRDMLDGPQGRPAAVVYDELAAQHPRLLFSGLPRHMFGEMIDRLSQRVPAAWKRAACYVERRRRLMPGPQYDADTVSLMLVRRLGWRVPGGVILVGSLSVRGATLLQLDGLCRRRQLLHDAFLAESLGQAPTDEHRGQLQIALARLWRVKWENMNKEVFWRMTIDGVPIVGNSHMRGQATPCLCGMPMGASVRRHHFWECAAAQEVVGCVAAVVACPVGITSVWLAQPPAGIMQQCVWDVVCLAMLSSMEEARIVLKVGARDASGSGDVVAHAKARAVSSFWRRLSDFVAIGPAPRDWVDVPADHPFVGVENGFLRLHRPVA